MIKVDRTNQLKIERRGLIITFKTRQGDQYAVPLRHIRAMCYGSLPYIYANEWTPKPVGNPHPAGRPLGSKNKPKTTIKNNIIIAL